jgi:cytidine deaminase
MSKQTQTRLGEGDSILSQMKVRRLSPEDLRVQRPDETTSETPESNREGSLREAAIDAAEGGSSTSQIGAAVRTSSGAVYTGVPVEGTGWDVHAVELAISKSVSEGNEGISRVAVYAPDDQSGLCGRCLQAIADYRENEPHVELLSSDDEIKTFKFDELYPQPWK